jgi:hypothetical protein
LADPTFFLPFCILSSSCHPASKENFIRAVHSLLTAIMLVLFVEQNFMEYVVDFIQKRALGFRTAARHAKLLSIGKTLISRFMDFLPCHVL